MHTHCGPVVPRTGGHTADNNELISGNLKEEITYVLIPPEAKIFGCKVDVEAIMAAVNGLHFI